MNKEQKKERTNFWHNWFKSCKVEKNFMGTCSVQNLIYNRDKEMIKNVISQHGFYQYAATGRGDSGSKGFKLK